jgi:hypothetical protein
LTLWSSPNIRCTACRWTPISTSCAALTDPRLRGADHHPRRAPPNRIGSDHQHDTDVHCGSRLCKNSKIEMRRRIIFFGSSYKLNPLAR